MTELMLAPTGVRTRVTVPLGFADGWTTTAEVVTFTGLAGRRRWPRTAGAAAQRMPDRRRPGLGALRLRPAAARGGGAHRRRGRLPAVPAPGGPRHRAVRQARRLRPAGRRAGHLRGQPGA